MNHYITKGRVLADVFCKNNMNNIVKIICIKEMWDGEIKKIEALYEDGKFIDINDKTIITEFMYDSVEFEISLSDSDYKTCIDHYITYEKPTNINLNDFEPGNYLVKYVCESSTRVQSDVLSVNLTNNKSKIGAIGSHFTFDLKYKLLCAYKID